MWLTKPNKQNKNKTKRQDSDGEISDLDEGQCVVRDIRGLLCVFVIRIRRLCMLAVVYICASVSDSVQCMCSLCLRAHTYTHTFTLSHTHSHTHSLSLPLAGLFASVRIYVRCMFARARTHTHLLSHARSFSHARRSVIHIYFRARALSLTQVCDAQGFLVICDQCENDYCLRCSRLL